jgi:pimeloyl-ACP methyl ester carboxylesterase
MHCTCKGKGDAILFIHGMPTNSSLWDGIIEQLAAHHRCFAVDLPGMGKTPFEAYSPDYLDRMAKQVEALRVRYGVKQWHVVGHDAGSAIAVHYAARFSRHVGCLALLSPAIFPDLKPFFLLNHLRRPVIGELLAPFLNLVFWQVAMRRALRGPASRRHFEAFYKPFSGPSGSWQLMRLVRWGKPEQMLGPIPAELVRLSMPTLLFRGSRDVLPALFTDRAASLIRKSSVLTFDSGHFLPLDRPGEVAVSLSNFFAVNQTKNEYASQSRTGNRLSMAHLHQDAMGVS